MSAAGELLWTASAQRRERSNIARFLAWLADARGLRFAGYHDLWRWSVDELEAFWQAVWDFYGVRSATAPGLPLQERGMPGATWFPGAELNYAEHVLDRAVAAGASIIHVGEEAGPREIGAQELRGRVGALAAALRDLGVGRGDRVAGYLPNIPEAVIAMLATTSLGATWSACAPDFGTRSVIDRFAQIEPTVLIAVDGYRFNGRVQDRREAIAQLQGALPTVQATILVRSLDPAQDPGPLGALPFEDLCAQECEPAFAAVSFDHPLWILFSSGTTGLPKGIVQGHGGILLEHLKSLGLCMDLRATDRYFFYSSTSWMAWNYLVGGLLHGATIIVDSGSPAHGGQDRIWRTAAQTGATVVGLGSAYVSACAKAGVRLGAEVDLGRLRTVIPTGSPLPPGGWRWLSEQLGPDVRIDSICGGTDVCTAFFGGSELLPVYLGEISCRWLGIAAAAYDEDGRELTGEVGEFVITRPMPSMPIGLWHDPDGRRYREAYFDTYPGTWRQGDWITISPSGSVTVSGRSDATLNRGGVRLGSAEIYAAVERLPEVADSLVVGVELHDGEYYMPLFVVPAEEGVDAGRLTERVASAIRDQLSPRHVPDEVIAVPAIPRTLTGKKLEVPVKRILQGLPPEQAAATGSIDRPDAFAWFAEFAARRRATPAESA